MVGYLDTHQLMCDSVATSTRAVYRSGLDRFVTFLKLNNYATGPGLPVVSEDILMTFVTYCYKILSLSYSTIKLYLCGIRFHYALAEVPNPLCNLAGELNSLTRLHGFARGQATEKNHQ
jgi:hypothetical protein